MVKINTKDRLHNIDDVFIFIKKYQQVYYTYTFFFRKDRYRVDWLFIVKTKSRGHVQVFQDDNDEFTVGDDVFQLELVDPYRVALSTTLKENSNLYVDKNTFVDVDVDVEELKDILRTSRHTEINEDDEIDELQFNKKDDDFY